MPATPRFSLAHAPDARHLAQVEGEELHHMRAVLRLAAGARVSLLDPAGIEHHGVIERYERERAVVRIESSSPSPARPQIILAAAIIKGPRMDFIVEKAAELGASELWPLVCARGLVRSPGAERLARWRRLALAAAKQSQSPSAMEVRSPVGVDDLIRGVPPGTLAVICAQGGEPLGEVIRRAHPRAILIAVGPEGDFDNDERAKGAKAGFVAAGLGPNRLRSETAALAAVAIAQGLLHDGQGSSEDAETK
ncbi:MAG TPA: RsmE family RNA methyltransferase [Candidatus Binatus sp.]|uniref:RsmE family RNA methyltransferase n=1 Tax=Candidatus Binatus sp. TaxID=2811406 RepID=UPI002B46B1A4|nr:RsmE family RNA methyltransferase [Candidatus Binatus sp.]HKN13430.1 RsmE family RNA methyltransferase [Candidatus Binatus sp.]